MKKLLLSYLLLFLTYAFTPLFAENENCLALLDLEANPDIVAVLPNESVTFNVLENDVGEGLFIKRISKQPLCGSVEIMNATIGEIRYTPDVGCLLNVINFEYEVEDIEGSLAIAEVKVVMNREGSELVVGVEIDCTNVNETGVHILYITILEGVAPFDISGSLNETLEEEGQVFQMYTDGQPFEIQIIDATGNEFHQTGGHTACTLLHPETQLNHIYQIGDCTCDGSLIVNFEKIHIYNETITKTLGYWVDNNGNEIEIGLGDTIPPNSFFFMSHIQTDKWSSWGGYTLATEDILKNPEGFTSDFCPPETYNIQAIDDFANTLPDEPITINVLTNDTGTNLQINAINLSPSCGEITDLNPETGEVVYIPHADTECTFDVFVYEVTQIDGSTLTATVFISINNGSNDLVVEIERDCTDAGLTGFYTLKVTVSDGFPFYTISGSINELLEASGNMLSVTIGDGFPYEIQVTDSAGNEFYETGGELSCCELYGEDINLILNEAESQTSVCGEAIVLSIEGGEEGTTYNWYWDETGLLPANPPTGQVWTNGELIGIGTIYVIATDTNGCESEPLAIETTRYEQLEITPNYDCLITETQDSVALLSFQTTGGDGNYAFNGNVQNDTLQNGDIYQIEVTDGNGCFAAISDTIACSFTSIESSITHSQSPIINLYPNPNKGNFTISFELKQTEDVDIEILDIVGRVKLWQRLETLPTVERQQDFYLGLPSGLYFIQVSGKNWTWIEKIIVE